MTMTKNRDGDSELSVTRKAHSAREDGVRGLGWAASHGTDAPSVFVQ